MATPPITGIGAGVQVDQPQVGAQRYGLFSAADGPFDMPDHGEIAGISYESLHLGNGFLWPGASCNAPGAAKTFGACNGWVYGAPFTVAASYQVGAFGRTEEEMRRNAAIRMRDNAQSLVEQMFWGGTTAAPVLSDVLTQADAAAAPTMVDLTPVPGTAVPIEQGVSLAEDYVAQLPYRGVLHARPTVSPYATERLLSVPDGKPGAAGTRYVSPMGNVWSYGRGYSGKNPKTGAAPAAGNAYIVVTGAVGLWRDPQVYVNPPFRSMDRSGNQVLVLAEQAWVATVEGVIGYVLVSLTGE